MKNRPILRAVIGVTIALVVGYLFYRTLRSDWETVKEIDLSFGWWTVWATLLFVLAVAASAILWGLIVHRLDGRHVAPQTSLRVHFASWLLKYIPGKISTLVNKVWWAQTQDRSRVMVMVSVVYENAFLLIGSIVPMLAILIAARSLNGDGFVEAKSVWVPFVAVLPLMLVMQKPVFRRIINRLARRPLKRDVPDEYFLSTSGAFTFQALYLVPRVINGIAVVVIAVALADAPAASWIPLGAAYALAGAAGIIVFFTPSGLFVREAVFVLFAAPYIGEEQAIVLAAVARVLSTLGDGVIAAIYGLLRLLPSERIVKVST